LIERWLDESAIQLALKACQRLPRRLARERTTRIIDVPTPRSAEKIIKSVQGKCCGPICFLRKTSDGVRALRVLGAQLGVSKILAEAVHARELLSAVEESMDAREPDATQFGSPVD